VEGLTVSAPAEGHTAQASAEVSEEVALTTLSSAVEVPAEVAPPEALVATLAPAVPVVSTTLAREEPAYIPHRVIERGSGSTSGDDTMEFLTHHTVHQFFDSMRSCIDFILSGGGSFEFARTFLGNLAENIKLAGGPSLAQACLLVVEQLGQDLRELRSLEDAGSFHEAQETLNRLLAAQEQERREVEEKITDNTRLLESFRADHQRLAIESKESEMVIQAAKQAILDSRAAIARAEAMIILNEQRLVVSEKKLAELEAAKAQVEANLSVRSSELESLRIQAQGFLSEADLRAQAIMEAEKARQHEIHRLREQIRSLANRDF